MAIDKHFAASYLTAPWDNISMDPLAGREMESCWDMDCDNPDFVLNTKKLRQKNKNNVNLSNFIFNNDGK